MTDFQSAFDTNTSGINTTLTTQLSSVQQWANIPGSLVKASSSQAGYLWGFNSVNEVYVCQQPCTGQWTKVDVSKLVTPASPAVAAVAPTPIGPPHNYSPINGKIGIDGEGGPTIAIGTMRDGNNSQVSLYISNQLFAGAQSGLFGEFASKNKITVDLFLWNGQLLSRLPVVYVGNGGNNTTVVSVGVLAEIFDNYVQPFLVGSSNMGKDLNVQIMSVPMSKGTPAVPATPAGTISAVSDIATDDTNVYLLFNTEKGASLATKTANNQTDWAVVPVGGGFVPANIFSTHTYLWLQSSTNQKVKIPKPINMTNTMTSTDTSVKITSSSPTALYGVDARGNAMKTDEMLQTAWTPVAGLSGTPVKSVIGDLDQSGLFYIDNNSNVSQCVGSCETKKSVPINTQGYLPLYLTADPSTKQLWMTSSTSGSVGNIFNRIANPDYSSILSSVTPMDQKRDTVVTDISKQYNQQTEVMTVNKQLSNFQDIFKRLFGEATKSIDSTNTQISKLQSDVDSKQSDLKRISAVEPIVQKFVVTLAVTALVYAIFSFLGWVVHVIALVVVGVGIYLSLNNDISLSNLWT
jgi:hypothetical protein